VERRFRQLPKYQLLKILRVPQAVSREFRARFLRLSLHRALDSEATQQEAAEETEEADGEQEREAQPFRHVLAGLVDAGHLEAENSLHPRADVHKSPPGCIVLLSRQALRVTHNVPLDQAPRHN